MHPHEEPPTRFAISRFLTPEDFRWVNPQTQQLNTHSFKSVKAQAIATARKALSMGTTAVFAANKRGKQGAIGLAEELLRQLSRRLPLPEPEAFVDRVSVEPSIEYVSEEYGTDWIGTLALQSGAVLHHGSIPQETREVVEALLRRGALRLAICTNTLAEGVNLPIRTLVLYSVQRSGAGGRPVNLFARDIKNLVGRAGRAGATTKGLVICANPNQWPHVQKVARHAPGEPVTGALRTLIMGLERLLAKDNSTLANSNLEATHWLYELIDGVDSILIDLAAEEVGEDELVELATRLADQTFASTQATPDRSRELLRNVFSLRARRVASVRSGGKLEWIRETGARVRMLDSVENDLIQRRPTWGDVTDPMDPELISMLLEWAWTQRELQAAVDEAYQPGISILPTGSGPLYTNTPLRTPDLFSARYSAPNSRQSGAALDGKPTGAAAFRAFLRHRSTRVPFLRHEGFVALSPRVSLPARVAPRSFAACRRTADGSDALPPAGASSIAHPSPAGPRFSPAAAGDW